MVSYHEIVDVAALLALEGPRNSISSEQLPPQLLHDTLRLSRLQSRQWLSAARDHRGAQRQRCDLIEEILIAEPRVRVLAAILARRDGVPVERGLCRISSRLLHDHALAKRFALTELLSESFPVGTLPRINILRVRMERWTDLLLGVSGEGIDARAFGFDDERVREHLRVSDRDEPPRDRLIFCGLRQAVPKRQVRDRVRSRTHRLLQGCILSLTSRPLVADCVPRTRLQERIFADHLTTDRTTRWRL